MQLLGIGFAKKSWELITNQIQRELSHQLNLELFDYPRLESEVEMDKEEIQNISINISKLKPEWIILNPVYFKNSEIFLILMDFIKSDSEKSLHFVMVIDDFKKNLSSYFKFLPEFELVNKMNFKLSSPDLVIRENFKSFPRIRLNPEFQRINYLNDNGELVTHVCSEIPENSLIPLKYIKKIETTFGEIYPEKWIEKILKKKNITFKIKQVLGIIVEKKGCYFFPGIPFNSIFKMKINKLCISHIIHIDECNIKSPAFKRLVKKMDNEYKSWLNENKKSSNITDSKIHCFIENPLIKNILEDVFNKMGQKNVKIFSEISYFNNDIKFPVNFLKLDNSISYDNFEIKIDWTNDFLQILSLLKGIVDLKDLRISKESKFLPIHKIEFEKLINKFYKEKKELNNLINQYEIDKMIYSQSSDVMESLDSFTKTLKNSLASSINLEEAHKKASEIKNLKLLVFCESEHSAAELNFKLKKVEKKLWINPFKFKKPEDLIQINTKMIKSYLFPESIIVNSNERIHLEKLCEQTRKEYEIAKSKFNEKILKIKYSKTDLKLINKNINHLVIRWLNVSFKQLLYRDRDSFRSL